MARLLSAPYCATAVLIDPGSLDPHAILWLFVQIAVLKIVSPLESSTGRRLEDIVEARHVQLDTFNGDLGFVEGSHDRCDLRGPSGQPDGDASRRCSNRFAERHQGLLRTERVLA